VFGNNERNREGRKKGDRKERNTVDKTKEWRLERKTREGKY